jgi:hypothetical protein
MLAELYRRGGGGLRGKGEIEGKWLNFSKRLILNAHGS